MYGKEDVCVVQSNDTYQNVIHLNRLIRHLHTQLYSCSLQWLFVFMNILLTAYCVGSPGIQNTTIFNTPKWLTDIYML